MNTTRFTKTLLAGVALALALYPQVWAELTVDDIVSNLRSGIANDTKYYNDDENGSYVKLNVHRLGDRFEYAMGKTDPVDSSNNRGTNWVRTNITINGQSVFTYNDQWYPTYDFDENGRLKAMYSANVYNGDLLKIIKYADDGQMLVYSPSGELLGAYNNWYESMVDSYYSNASNPLSHLIDGKYTAKDENNNVLGEYYADGSYRKNQYDTSGNLISSNKYDKDNNILESSVNKYDGAGNLTAAIENGVSTYKRTSYTPAEAAKAIKKGNNNTITLTFK